MFDVQRQIAASARRRELAHGVNIDPRFRIRQTYAPEEVAAMLEVSLATVYRYLDCGKLPEIERRLGRPRRIPVEAFHEMFPEIRQPLQMSLPFAR